MQNQEKIFLVTVVKNGLIFALSARFGLDYLGSNFCAAAVGCKGQSSNGADSDAVVTGS